MKILDVKNPEYVSHDGSLINLEVLFESVGYPVLFTASPNDLEAHGRLLYSEATEGSYGPIKAYSGPSEEDLNASAVRKERDALLTQMDRVVSNPLRWAGLTQNEKDAYATYRQALLDVPQQDGFPLNVEWPVL